ncbi:MAG: 5'/3'-nucleotidase SurE [Phycisphaerales bacterium]|nr:5'/3'-nucleotidase SurE [Phycisphaerales bacterium]
MHVLITNDDGYESPGLVALHDAVKDQHTVSVVAPSGERSVCGHAATLKGPIRVRAVDHPTMGLIFAVDGTPADCVRLAISTLLREPVDLVLSGINLGANVSTIDVHSSGTVAAAREGAFNGIPSIAVSHLHRKTHPMDWSLSAQIVARLIPQLLGYRDRVRLWNVNLPALPPGQRPSGVCIAPLSTDPIPLTYRVRDADDGSREYEYTGFFEGRVIRPGTDVAVVFGDQICVTPLNLDATAPLAVGPFTVTP